MKISVLFRNSMIDIKQNKKRTILTMLGIIIGIGAVILIMSIGHGFQRHVIRNLMPNNQEEVSLLIEFVPKDNSLYSSGTNVQYFKEYELRELEKISGIKTASYTKKEDSTQTMAEFTTLNNGKEMVYVDLIKGDGRAVTSGRPLNPMDNSENQRVAVINLDLAKKMFGKLESYLGKGIKIGGQLYAIVGISEGADSFITGKVQIPLETYYFYSSQSSASTIELVLEKGAVLSDVQNKAVEYLENKGSLSHLGSYSVYNIGQMLGGISTILDALTIFISLIAAISLLIAGIGMMNMMFISVSERTKEIGIRRALGATKREIKSQFILEGVIITTLGGIMGYLFGMALAFLATQFLPFSVTIEASTIILALSVSMAIGIIFSYSPANSAANKNVIEII